MFGKQLIKVGAQVRTFFREDFSVFERFLLCLFFGASFLLQFQEQLNESPVEFPSPIQGHLSETEGLLQNNLPGQSLAAKLLFCVLINANFFISNKFFLQLPKKEKRMLESLCWHFRRSLLVTDQL